MCHLDLLSLAWWFSPLYSHSSFVFSPFDSFGCSSCFCFLPRPVSSSLSLLLPDAAAWSPKLASLDFPPLLHRWKLLSLTVGKNMRKRVATRDTISGNSGGQSPKIWFWTSFGPRSHLVLTSLKRQPVKTQPGEFWKGFAMVYPISGVPWRNGYQNLLTWSIICCRDHSTATSTTSKFDQNLYSGSTMKLGVPWGAW